jgi:DNA topoisomerase-3
MSKQLIIAEKPSVAADIARALGGFTREKDYFENEHYVLSSAIGHLLELIAPEGCEIKRGKWSFAHLPVIPPHFDLHPIDKTADRLRLLTKLIKRKDVTGLINACDAGREGELIFRYIVQHTLDTKNHKPIRRLWLQSMTASAIRSGFAQLRSDIEMQPLADAARCRSEADWLIGINGTRAMTAFNSKEGGFHKTPVGRVQTPTLAILVEREQRIRAFKSRDYWEVEAEFQCVAGSYRGRWFDEVFKKNDDEHARAERIWDESRAQAVRVQCLGKPARATDESKPKSELSPLLFDLTSLQREANSRFGFPARMTLALAQALYEKHKALTYPRTDSRYLPEDMIAQVKDTMNALVATDFGHWAQTVVTNGWVHPNKRIFNNAKVSDHFALIPTGAAPKSLSEAEQKLYDLVVRRFLAVFYPAAEYHLTTRITRIENQAFKTEGRVLLKPGWLAVYGKAAATGDGELSLPPLAENERIWPLDVEIKPNQTRPPARLNEATLLSAMEGAGKLVDDEELREAMSERGLGTPATRAAIIEGLIAEEYVHRQGRELQPTAKAFSLIFALEQLRIDEIRSPELTGLWEWKLKEMEHGRLSRDEFMRHIMEQTDTMVSRIKTGEFADPDFGPLGAPCPKCGGVIHETYKHFKCERCDYRLWKIMSGRQWEPDEMTALLTQGQIGPLRGFRSKMGRAFEAVIRLDDTHNPKFDFENETDRDAEVDFSGQPPLGQCPKCKGTVYAGSRSYVCERAIGAEKHCDFKFGKTILQQEISSEDIALWLTKGRTRLLKGFVSNRTKRRFSAYLVREEGGKMGFAFEERQAKTPGSTSVAAKTPASRRRSTTRTKTT